ncbi:MAG TPA: DUF6088 family protein [Phycisphaerae bacterium]|nr:DUF6088 family protein [Phycisphaerae bacterium]
MTTLPQSILKSFQKAPTGKVCATSDFLHLGTRTAIDQALSRLVRRGDLRRVCRGLYDLPRVNVRFNLAVPPEPDQLAAAAARRNGAQLLPSGAMAANMLGLSTQVPAKAVYLTSGRSQTLKAGNLTIHLRHVASQNFSVKNHSSALVIQALKHLGKQSVTERMLAILRSRLTRAQRRNLLDDARYAPAWVANIAKALTCE